MLDLIDSQFLGHAV